MEHDKLSNKIYVSLIYNWVYLDCLKKLTIRFDKISYYMCHLNPRFTKFLGRKVPIRWGDNFSSLLFVSIFLKFLNKLVFSFLDFGHTFNIKSIEKKIIFYIISRYVQKTSFRPASVLMAALHAHYQVHNILK